MKKFLKNKIHLWLIVVLMAVVAGASAISYAKYVKQEELDGTLTISVDVGEIILQEHKATRQSDGSYVLEGTTPEGECDGNAQHHIISSITSTVGNEYMLLPGYDIPKDPHVIITKNNTLPVIVFVEVVNENEDTAVTYEINSHWKEVTGVTGEHQGKVYVYTAGGIEPVKIVDSTEKPLYILENNEIIVSQELMNDKTVGSLRFYASMYQVTTDDVTIDPANIYNNSNLY